MKTSALHSVKFFRLKRRLQAPSYQVIGILEALWILTATNAPDGAIGRFTNEDIAAYLEWRECPDKLIRDLTESGWLDAHPDHRLVVHDWEHHCPTFVKGSMKRHGKDFVDPEKQKFPKEPAKEVAKEPPKEPAKQPPNSMPLPNLTYSNLTKPNSLETIVSCPELQKSSELVPVDDSPEVCTFPTNGQIKTWILRESMVAQWRAIYPGLDVEAEIRKSLGWIQTSPERRKTAKGMPRFLFSWLDRANDRKKQNAQGTFFHQKPSAIERAAESAERLISGKSTIANQIFAELQAMEGNG